MSNMHPCTNHRGEDLNTYLVPEPCCGSMEELSLQKHTPPPYPATSAFKSSAQRTIQTHIEQRASDLKPISLYLHDHPELGYHEFKAYAKLTTYFKSLGFEVEEQCGGLETAWKVTFKHGTGGRVIGFNSEFDALPGIGERCLYE